MIRFACPGCDARFTIDDDQAGRAGECPSCAARFRIPEALSSGPLAESAEKPESERQPTPTAVCPHCEQVARIERVDFGYPVLCPGCARSYTPSATGSELAEVPSRRDRRDWGDERPRRRRRRDRDDGVPSTVRTAGYLLLIGGIYAPIHLFIALLSSYCCCAFWPTWWMAAVWAVLAIIRGSAYLGSGAGEAGRPRTLQIVQILCILNLDVVNCVLGIVGLTTCGTTETHNYFDRFDRQRDDE